MQILGDRTISLAADAPIDARIGLIAAAQHLRVNRAQLSAGGVDRHAIDRRLAGGRLIRVHPAVFALAPATSPPLADEAAALLGCGPHAMLSHHSAAVLWGLRPGVARPVHVTVPDGRYHRVRESVIVHRSRILEGADRRLHQGLPVTSPARTLLDVCATTLTDRDIERLLDEAIFARRLATRAEILALLGRSGGHPGRSRLTRVLHSHLQTTRTESVPEEALLRIVRSAGLPAPDVQTHVLGHRLDFLWRARRIAVEVDSYGTHGSPARFEADRRRDTELLTRAGIAVLRFTRNQILADPIRVAADLVRALAGEQIA